MLRGEKEISKELIDSLLSSSQEKKMGAELLFLEMESDELIHIVLAKKEMLGFTEKLNINKIIRPQWLPPRVIEE